MLCRTNSPERKPTRPESDGPALPEVRPTETLRYPDRDALYQELQPLVRRLIRQYGTSTDLRQDLISEIYCRFCGLLAAYEPDSGIPVRPYLIRTLPPAIYSYMRSQWRHQSREVALVPDLEDGALLREPDPTPKWDHTLWVETAAQHLPAAIARLPERQRHVLVARYYESRTFDEIATALEIRPATARSLLRHAIAQLRRRMSMVEDPALLDPQCPPREE